MARRWRLEWVCASRLAERLGRVDARFTARQRDLLAAFGLAHAIAARGPGTSILRTMLHDKKVEHGRLRFVLPTRLGQVELVGGIDPEDVRAAIS